MTDSISERDSEKSIVKCSNDIFVEINEKLSAQFTPNGFAIHIKVNGIVSVKNYILGKTHLKLQTSKNFSILNDNLFKSKDVGYSGGSSNMQMRLTQVDENVLIQENDSNNVFSSYPKIG